MFFDHQVGFEGHFPVQNDADVEQTVFLDLKICRKGVLVPSEQDARSHGFNVHGRGFDDRPVFRGILENFFMEHLVFAPASHSVEIIKVIGKSWDMKVAAHEAGIVTILFAGIEILANHELKKPDLLRIHSENIKQGCPEMQEVNTKILNGRRTEYVENRHDNAVRLSPYAIMRKDLENGVVKI